MSDLRMTFEPKKVWKGRNNQSKLFISISQQVINGFYHMAQQDIKASNRD